ncbi:hypothetical protein NEQG_02022 [Nematocida parisii ERTm3]|uniref:Uncharacterized protein n=1 Tax=Nematocida parisii (strain ERTm3) TaxID=935791 RepID=I3EFF3_NEMP3|nr:hypothetical protein NEQG_02022 [Nematocida parisii ERTm3]
MSQNLTISKRPFRMTAASVLAPSLCPDTIPHATATTFFSVPHTSTAPESLTGVTLKYLQSNNSAKCL